MLGHAADLAVQALYQDDAEHKPGNLLDLAALGHGAQDWHAVTHALDEFPGDRLIHRHQVFFLVVITGPQDLVHQVAVTGEETQALGVFSQPPDRETSLAVADNALDIVFLGAVGGADDAHRLVQGDKDQLFFIPAFHHLAVHLHHIAPQHLVSHLGTAAIDVNITLLDVTVSIPARAHAALADVFVQSGGGSGVHGALPDAWKWDNSRSNAGIIPPGGRYGNRQTAARPPNYPSVIWNLHQH